MKAALIALSVVLLALLVWFAPKWFSRAKFAGFPGVYICKDFGMPDDTHSTLRIDEQMRLFGVSAEGEVAVGQLSLIEGSKVRARITFLPEVIHSATFALDPAAEHVAEGLGDSLVMSATHEGKLQYSEPCFRK